MQKSKRTVLKSFISMFIILAMIITSIPSTSIHVSAANNKQKKTVSLNYVSKNMCIGDTYQFKLVNKPEKAKYTWSSSKKNVATVNEKGVVKAKSVGTTTISCKVKKDKKVVVLKAKVKVTDQAKISSVTVSNQKELNRVLKDKNIKVITIKTSKDIELNIDEGDYSTKKLVVDAPQGTISNYGLFSDICIKNIKPHTWKEFAKGNKITLLSNASIYVEQTADVDVSINKVNVTVLFQLFGKADIQINKICNVIIEGSTDSNVQIAANVEADIKTEIPVQIDTTKRIKLELNSKAAASTTVKVSDEKLLPEIKGGSIKVVTSSGKEIIVTEQNNSTEQPTTPTPSNESPSQGNPTPVVPVDNGLDANGRIVANFGSPEEIDGIIDDIWSSAKAARFKNYSYGDKTTDTKATLKVLWDDNALYFLAEVKDSEKSLQPANVYEKDSVEFFLDQDNKRAGDYDPDDSQFRINYHNEQSCDHGDLTNCYTAARETADGYIIEGRVALSKTYVTPDNDVCMGIEAQLNDAQGASRVGTISIFDTTGTAYRNTSKFGEVILKGKTADSVTKPSSYDLRALVQSAKKIQLERYENGVDVANLITSSEEAIASKIATQEQYDSLVQQLSLAIKNLVHNDLSFDEKECRDIPKEYKTSDPEEQRGTLVFEQYETERFDKPGETYPKNMMIYLPHGYNQEDTSKKYNVLYLVHGMAETEFTPLGIPGSNGELMRVVDNLIAEGKMEPMIIVSPTWYYEKDAGMFELDNLVKNFHIELQRDILPYVEGKYNTYAENTTAEGLKASRDHRAFGGFSMGGNCTWYQFEKSFEYFKYFVPVSMWSWLNNNPQALIDQGYHGKNGDEDANAVVANYFAKVPELYGYTKDDFCIFAATGTADLAYPGMPNQIEAMKAEDGTFTYSADLRKGNFYFLLMEGGAHNWTCVNQYLYNILPDLFTVN